MLLKFKLEEKAQKGRQINAYLHPSANSRSMGMSKNALVKSRSTNLASLRKAFHACNVVADTAPYPHSSAVCLAALQLSPAKLL